MVHNVKQTIAEGFLVLCYIFVLHVIVRSKTKTFKNAFYGLFVATGITDVASLFSCCFLRLNYELSLSEDFQNAIRCSLVITYAAFVSHLIGNILITINRYSALRYLNRHDSIWTRKTVCRVVVLQYIVSFAVFAHIVGAKLIYVHNADGTVKLKNYEIPVDIIIRSTFFVTSVIYTITSVIFNARLVFEWKRLPKINGCSKRRHHEKVLLIHTMLVFICSLSLCAVQFAKAIASLTSMDALNAWLTMQYFWMNDLMMSISPFSLLLLSPDLRKEVTNFFRHKKRQNVVTVSVSNRSARRSVVGRSVVGKL